LEAEFPAEADPGGLSRRRWLQLMGASLALAGLSGCRWEQREIRPFAHRPANRVPGMPERFATAIVSHGHAIGLLVTSVDGRPIKVEGNPQHPQSLGATDLFAQAAVLEMYDPDRSRNLHQRTPQGDMVQDWNAFGQFLQSQVKRLAANGGDGFHVLSEANSSPTLAALREKLLATFPRAAWHEYEPLSPDNEREGSRLAFGKPYRPLYHLDRAEVIVCLDADLLNEHPAALAHTRAFAKGREVTQGTMNRLYAVEGRFTLTGTMADHRLRLRSGQVAAFTSALEREVSLSLRERVGVRGRKTNLTVAESVPGSLHPNPFSEGEGTAGRAVQFVRAVARDLIAHRGRGLVVAGPSQPPEVHVAVHRINEVLGNAGTTVTYLPEPHPDRPSHLEAIRGLVAEMSAGKVDTLLILGGNPVYNAPGDLKFAEALKKVATSIHLSRYRDETSLQSTWHVPEAHFLEAWGDARSYDGTYSIVQPLIDPLWGGRSAIEVLAGFLGEEKGDSPHLPERPGGGFAQMGTVPFFRPGGYDLVRSTFKELLAGDTAVGESVGNALRGVPEPAEKGHPQLPERHEGRSLQAEADFESTWKTVLHDGLWSGSAWPAETPKPRKRGQNDLINSSDPFSAWTGGPLEIVFTRGATVDDGRYANSGWLQETPDPMTKVTWDNAAVLAPATAAKLGVRDDTLVRLKYAGQEREIPAYLLPGVAEGTVVVSLGYGRTAAGQVGGSQSQEVAGVGVDLYPLRQSRAPFFDQGATIEPTGKACPLATTQDHHAIDTVGAAARDERIGELVREATLAQYQNRTRHAPRDESPHAEREEYRSLWEEKKYEGHRWGMSIDLSKCIGCNACTVACTAENNVPIVGKPRVLKGREMHWIRVDRYFGGADPDEPTVSHQVVACQQCENAPCEQVCPVMATVHSSEGLNDMVYNRCVGTRYCSNNCPYKVRRFNFFNYHKDLEDASNEVLKMLYNPEVTVRSRGVMEKCTYCVQRIQAVKIDAKNHQRPIRDGEIRTACQQACPAQAIVFGDLADPKSEVARRQALDRSYGILTELNTKPRTAYLARIRNVNPEL
jgi:molybdopterin-containing oxidoreductase family iron-sulfur binding subunit